MEIPSGFENKYTTWKVCILPKSLYGLKQSPRASFGKFTNLLKKDGYPQCQSDHAMFIKHFSPSKIIVLIVCECYCYHRKCLWWNKSTKTSSPKEIWNQRVGTSQILPRMEVARSSKGISVTQLKYTLDLLKEIELSGCKPADTPMDANSKLGLNPEDEPVDQDRYQRD